MLTAHQLLGDRAAKNKFPSSVVVTVGPIVLREDKTSTGQVRGVVQGRGGNKHKAT